MEARLNDVSAELDALIRTVKSVAAAEVMPRFLKVAHHRKSDGSLFTEADVAAQEALARGLPDIYPGTIVGEEMTRQTQVEHWLAGGAGAWCVDPIDGTSNFVNGLPYFAVSVALMRHGRTVLGVVYDPVADECFDAEAGRGAGRARRFRSRSRHPNSGRHGERRFEASAATAEALAARRPSASWGASTLEWCCCPSGSERLPPRRPEALGLRGSLILSEAGGHMATIGSDDFWSGDLWKRSVIAALDPGLFVEWKTWIRARLG